MTSISLNELAGGHNTSTYGGSLDVWEGFADGLTEDEAEAASDAISREEIKRLLSEIAEQTFSFLKEPLAKYGVTVQDFHFFMPREYNFMSDSVDMKFEADDQPIDPDLYPAIEKWLKEKQTSCDGYMDLQPDTIEEADKEDYCFLNAVLEKEGLNLEDGLKDFIEAATEALYDYYWSLVPKDTTPENAV